MAAAATSGRHRRDRLSALPDGILARVLSHLGSIDAACAAALSRRWRNIPAAVPVVDLADPESDQITTAIADKHSIRTFRIGELWPPHDALDQAVAAATAAGLEELDVKLRYRDCTNRRLCPSRRHPKASADFDESIATFTAAPHHIFRCDTLRRLRLTNFTLELPSGGVVSMPSLETLSLKKIMANEDEDAVQRLVSGCPNLADLTLEQCPTVADLVVASPRLESFAMLCCHKARRVVLQTQRLRILRYRGGLPAGESFFFSIADCTHVLALTIDICESLAEKSAPAVAPVTKLITQCTSLTFLHLHLRPSMAYHSGAFTRALRRLPHLRQLALKGVIRDDQTVRSVSTLLRNTPGLDVLSLFPLCPHPPKPYYLGVDSDDEYDGDEKGDDGTGAEDDGQDPRVRVPLGLWESEVACLHKLRKIKLVNYIGKPNERLLAKYLLSKSSSALEQFYVTLPAKTTESRQYKLTKELAYWRASERTTIMYTL